MHTGDQSLPGTHPLAAIGALLALVYWFADAAVVWIAGNAADFYTGLFSPMPADVFRRLLGAGLLLALGIAGRIPGRKRMPARNATGGAEILRQLADNIDFAVWIRDVESGRILFVNRSYEAIWQRPCESLYKAPFSFAEAIPEEERESVLAIVKLQGDTATGDYEHRVARPDGTVRWVRAHNFPIADEKGRPLRAACICEDITERRQTKEVLKESEAIFSAAVDRAGDGVAIIQDGRLAYLNPAFARISGYGVDELIGMNFQKMIEAEFRERVADNYRGHLEGKDDPEPSAIRMRAGDGSRRDITLIGRGVLYKGKPAGMIVLQDVTERKRAEEELRRQALTFENIFDAVIMTNLEGRIVDLNPSAERMFGITKEKAVGKTPSVIRAPDETDPMTNRMLLGTLADGRWQAEINYVRPDESPGVCESIVVPMHDSDGALVATIGVYRDITARKRAEEMLRRIAISDGLTGLFNRRHLMERIEAVVSSARRHRQPLSACMCDLDHFKRVNDTFGHRAGDEVLAAFGKLIKSSIRIEDIAGRYGGEEFCVVFPHTKPEDVVSVLERMRLRLQEHAFTSEDGRRFNVTASFGVAALAGEKTGETELLSAADQALYRAKEEGRNRIVVG